MHKSIYTLNWPKPLGPVFCSFRSYSAKAITVGKKTGWQVCKADSKVYLRAYDVEYVLGDDRTLLLYMKLHQYVLHTEKTSLKLSYDW
jgi:hypothetical protein